MQRNTLVTISDNKIGVSSSNANLADFYEARVLSATDYYAFGMSMKERSWQSEGYRYGFNGKENDGDWEVQDYGFRIYKPEIAKFLSVDPLTKDYPSWSPYPFAMNRPIQCIDLDGLESLAVNFGFRFILTPVTGYIGIGLVINSDGASLFYQGAVGPAAGKYIGGGFSQSITLANGDGEFYGWGASAGVEISRAKPFFRDISFSLDLALLGDNPLNPEGVKAGFTMPAMLGGKAELPSAGVGLGAYINLSRTVKLEELIPTLKGETIEKQLTLLGLTEKYATALVKDIYDTYNAMFGKGDIKQGYHQVQAGENFGSLAKKFGWGNDWNASKRLGYYNKRKTLQAGEYIKVFDEKGNLPEVDQAEANRFFQSGQWSALKELWIRTYSTKEDFKEKPPILTKPTN